jgi:hypothetical protein
MMSSARRWLLDIRISVVFCFRKTRQGTQIVICLLYCFLDASTWKFEKHTDKGTACSVITTEACPSLLDGRRQGLGLGYEGVRIS